MGFYGNIRNTTSNSFKFDRVYPNRTLMEQHADDDGVFGGRYVLVEYDQNLDESPIKGNEVVYKINYGTSYKYYSEIITSFDPDPLPEAYLRLENSTTIDRTTKVYYVKFGEEITNIETAFEPGTVICERSFNKLADNKTLYYQNGENPTILQIAGVQIWSADPNEARDYTLYTYLYDNEHNKIGIPNTNDSDAYTINYAIDKAIYGIGRGYDSTVWRKTYSADGKAKYVNIADLNSVVPTFAVTADAPYDIPTKPHWDKDSTNVYYNLHLQGPWSFRIADISDTWNAQKETGSFVSTLLDKSDCSVRSLEKVYDEHGQYIGPYDSSGHYMITQIEKEYPGAIYFNKAGFDVNESVHSGFEIDQNEIRMDNYKSGIKYPDRYDPTSTTKIEDFDTKELSIILPAIGDTVAHMWDTIYGVQRKQNISWDDANSKSDFDEERLRLVHDDNYTPADSQTLAGVINSAHDLMGMIITDPSSSIDGERMPNDANEAHQWQIYYNPVGSKGNPNYNRNAYYYAGTTLGFEELEYPFVDEDGNPVARTAESFKEYFGEENQGYVKVNGLKDIHTYVNNSENKPLFANRENGNIYKRVKPSIEFANAGEVYYNIPTKLTYIAAVMRPNDTRFWYYHPENSPDDFRQLPQDEKEAAMEDSRDYYWIDTSIASESGNDNAYIINDGDSPLFRIWRLKSQEGENVEENRDYSYERWDNWPNFYLEGRYTSFDDVIDAQQIVREEDPIEIQGISTAYGKKGNVFYDIEHVFYQTGTTTYYDEATDTYITGNKYKSHRGTDVIFAPHQIIGGNEETQFYLYNEAVNGNVSNYQRKTWAQLVASQDITTATGYMYQLKVTRLRREGECYYFKLDDSTAEGRNKIATLDRWVKNGNRPTDVLDIEEDGYLDYILEFNRNKQEDSLNPNYHYFLVDEGPTRVAYGIAEKKSAYEEPYVETNDTERDSDKTYYIKNNGVYEPYLTDPFEEGITIYEKGLTVFYTEKTLYFIDENDDLYKKAEKENDYTFDETNYGSNKYNSLYRKNNEYYIVDCGRFTGFNIYEKLNVEIIQEDEDLDYFFGDYKLSEDTVLIENKRYYQKVNGEYVLYEGNTFIDGLYDEQLPLKIGYGFKEYTWKELYGFAKDINTLHGWLLRLNEILQPNDTRTRDPNTIQGCINLMKDLLDKFGPLIPGFVLAVDDCGKIVGRKLADIILKSDGTDPIGTLTAPTGDIPITTSESLRSGIEKLIAHINAGASNITLNEYNNYYDDSPYFVTTDTEWQDGKTYYIKQGDTFVEYTTHPWPTENRPVIYERYTVINGNIPDVDDDDNINEAIAKLQWQLNHIANRLLTDLDLPSNAGSNSAIAATDTLGQALNKLQAQLSHSIEGSDNSGGVINNYAGIIRCSISSKGVPSTVASTNLTRKEFVVEGINSGWIWVETDNNQVYIKTQPGTNSGTYQDTEDGIIKKNYWELINAWQ